MVDDDPVCRLHLPDMTRRTRYACRVRAEGHRKWVSLHGYHRNSWRAAERLSRVFGCGGYKRGQVLMLAEYYEPVVVVELVRR